MSHIKVVLAALAVILSVAGCTLSDTPPSVDPSETEVVETTAATVATTPVSSIPETTESTEETKAADVTTVPETSNTETTHKHNYSFKITQEPTCTRSGVRTHTCKECGASYTENIKPLDHAFVITKVEPDCLNSGYTSYHCKECGYAYNEDVLPALGHSYGPLTTIQNPTEMQPGLAEHIFIRCGAVERVILPCLTPEQ